MDEIAELRRRLDAEGRITVLVKVVPRSSRTRLAGRMDDGALKITVAATPEKGKANTELCDFLAGQLEVPKSAVSVQSGHTSTRKRLLVVKPAARP